MSYEDVFISKLRSLCITMGGTLPMMPPITNHDEQSLALLDAILQATSPKSARVFHSVNQAIATSTLISLAFDSERFDTDSIHDTVINNHRLSCRTAGRYLMGGNVRFASSMLGNRYLGIRLNDAITIASTEPSALTALSVSTAYDLVPGDYITLQVQQTSGAALNVEALPSTSPEFWMVRL